MTDTDYKTTPIIAKAMQQAAALRRTLSELVYDDVYFAGRCSMLGLLNAADEIVYDLESVEKHSREEAGERPLLPVDREFKGLTVAALAGQLAGLPPNHPLAGFKLDDSFSDKGFWQIIRPHPELESLDETVGYFTWSGLLDRMNEMLDAEAEAELARKDAADRGDYDDMDDDGDSARQRGREEQVAAHRGEI